MKNGEQIGIKADDTSKKSIWEKKFNLEELEYIIVKEKKYMEEEWRKVTVQPGG